MEPPKPPAVGIPPVPIQLMPPAKSSLDSRTKLPYLSIP